MTKEEEDIRPKISGLLGKIPGMEKSCYVLTKDIDTDNVRIVERGQVSALYEGKYNICVDEYYDEYSSKIALPFIKPEDYNPWSSANICELLGVKLRYLCADWEMEYLDVDNLVNFQLLKVHKYNLIESAYSLAIYKYWLINPKAVERVIKEINNER